jgi:hypothetical protein
MLSPTNNWRFVDDYHTNLHAIRLSFLWPMLSAIPPGRELFRGEVAGSLSPTTEPGFAAPSIPWSTTLFFMQPRTYLQVQTP